MKTPCGAIQRVEPTIPAEYAANSMAGKSHRREAIWKWNFQPYFGHPPDAMWSGVELSLMTSLAKLQNFEHINVSSH